MARSTAAGLLFGVVGSKVRLIGLLDYAFSGSARPEAFVGGGTVGRRRQKGGFEEAKAGW